jgi:hypothetical protein
MSQDNVHADEAPPPTPSAMSRLALSARPRATKANLLAALLALLLGFAMATQVHQNQSAGLETLSQSDLLSILDNATQPSRQPSSDSTPWESWRAPLVHTGQAFR